MLNPDLQTILDHLLKYGINSEDENIASGAMRHLPIILLKNFRSVDLDLAPLIAALLKKESDPDAVQLMGPLEAFLGRDQFNQQLNEAKTQIQEKVKTSIFLENSFL